MKVLTAVLLVVLMIGITPACAVVIEPVSNRTDENLTNVKVENNVLTDEEMKEIKGKGIVTDPFGFGRKAIIEDSASRINDKLYHSHHIKHRHLNWALIIAYAIAIGLAIPSRGASLSSVAWRGIVGTIGAYLGYGDKIWIYHCY